MSQGGGGMTDLRARVMELEAALRAAERQRDELRHDAAMALMALLRGIRGARERERGQSLAEWTSAIEAEMDARLGHRGGVV